MQGDQPVHSSPARRFLPQPAVLAYTRRRNAAARWLYSKQPPFKEAFRESTTLASADRHGLLYTGYYTLRQADRIEGNSPIRATLRAAGETVAGNYLFPAQPDARFARIDLPRMWVAVERPRTAILGAPPR